MRHENTAKDCSIWYVRLQEHYRKQSFQHAKPNTPNLNSQTLIPKSLVAKPEFKLSDVLPRPSMESKGGPLRGVPPQGESFRFWVWGSGFGIWS